MLAALFVLLSVACAYSNSLGGPFIWDDLINIPQNPRIRALGLQALAGTSRPLVTLTFAINYALGGLDVRGYHLFNVVIHLTAALMLFVLVRATLRTRRLRSRFGDRATALATATAAIWAVHPLHTEAVTYVVQRSEEMAGLLFILSLWTMLRGAESARPMPWYSATASCCLLGVTCKPVMATAPLVALLYDRAFVAGSLRQAFSQRWGLFLVLALSIGLLPILLAAAPEEWKASSGFGVEGRTPAEYAFAQLAVVPHYLRLAFWPSPLVLDYWWPMAPAPISVLPGALLIGALLALTAWGLARNTAMGFLGAWFFIILAPTSSIMPLADAAFEHRMYLPLAAVVTLVVFGFDAVGIRDPRLSSATDPRAPGTKHPGPALRRSLIGAALLLLLVASLGWATFRRNADYRSALSIWSDTVAKRPLNPRAQVQVGILYAEADHPLEAMHAFTAALRVKPDYGVAIGDLGRSLELLGKEDEAIHRYFEALHRDPTLQGTRYWLAFALVRRGRVAEGEAQLAELVRRYPSFVQGRKGLGHVYALESRTADAETQFRAALALDPWDDDARRELAQLRAGRAHRAR